MHELKFEDKEPSEKKEAEYKIELWKLSLMSKFQL